MTKDHNLHPVRNTIRYAVSLRATIRDPRFTVVIGATVGLVAIGSVFYWQVENWPLLDAVYFSVVTLATVGYGDYTPQTAAGKVFTMVFILLGVGLLGSFLSLVAGRAVRRASVENAADDLSPNSMPGPADGKAARRSHW